MTHPQRRALEAVKANAEFNAITKMAPKTIRVTSYIWDYGDDHHPHALLARPGDVLNVLKSTADGYEVARHGNFLVFHHECEPISKPTG